MIIYKSGSLQYLCIFQGGLSQQQPQIFSQASYYYLNLYFNCNVSHLNVGCNCTGDILWGARVEIYFLILIPYLSSIYLYLKSEWEGLTFPQPIQDFRPRRAIKIEIKVVSQEEVGSLSFSRNPVMIFDSKAAVFIKSQKLISCAKTSYFLGWSFFLFPNFHFSSLQLSLFQFHFYMIIIRNIPGSRVTSLLGFFKFPRLSKSFSDTHGFDAKLDYFSILGVSKSSNIQQIKQAFRSKAKLFHPDINPKYEEDFKLINQAYRVLTDDKLRSRYTNLHSKIPEDEIQKKRQTQSLEKDPASEFYTIFLNYFKLKRRQALNIHFRRNVEQQQTQRQKGLREREQKQKISKQKRLLDYLIVSSGLLSILIMFDIASSSIQPKQKGN